MLTRSQVTDYDFCAKELRLYRERIDDLRDSLVFNRTKPSPESIGKLQAISASLTMLALDLEIARDVANKLPDYMIRKSLSKNICLCRWVQDQWIPIFVDVDIKEVRKVADGLGLTDVIVDLLCPGKIRLDNRRTLQLWKLANRSEANYYLSSDEPGYNDGPYYQQGSSILSWNTPTWFNTPRAAKKAAEADGFRVVVESITV